MRVRFAIFLFSSLAPPSLQVKCLHAGFFDLPLSLASARVNLVLEPGALGTAIAIVMDLTFTREEQVNQSLPPCL